jgi:hypothetical protein
VTAVAYFLADNFYMTDINVFLNFQIETYHTENYSLHYGLKCVTNRTYNAQNQQAGNDECQIIKVGILLCEKIAQNIRRERYKEPSLTSVIALRTNLTFRKKNMKRPPANKSYERRCNETQTDRAN